MAESTGMTIVVGTERYSFDPDHVRNDEAMSIEKITGSTFAQWIDAVTEGSVTALTALIWLLQKRENSKIKFADVRFEMGDFDVEWNGPDDENPVEDEDGTGDSDPANPTPSEAVTPDEGTAT